MKYLTVALLFVALFYVYPAEAEEKFRIVCEDGTDTIIVVRDGVRYFVDGRPLRTKPGIKCVVWVASKLTIVPSKKKGV